MQLAVVPFACLQRDFVWLKSFIKFTLQSKKILYELLPYNFDGILCIVPFSDVIQFLLIVSFMNTPNWVTDKLIQGYLNVLLYPLYSLV